MEKLSIMVILDAKTAIKLGLPEAGEQAYPLVGVLPKLDEPTRSWLAAHIGRRQRVGSGFEHDPDGAYTLCFGGSNFFRALPVPSTPSDEVVAGTLVAVMRADLDEIAKREARDEEKILAALNAPIDDWLRISGNESHYLRGKREGRPSVASTPSNVYSVRESDPRFIARREEVRRLAAPLIEKWEKEHAEWKRRTEEAELFARQAAELEAKSFAAWAAQAEVLPPNVRRAAQEGVDVKVELKRIVGTAIRAYLTAIASPLGGDVPKVVYEPKASERVPSDRAYAIRDALEAARDGVAAAALVPGTEVSVGPFERVDISESRSVVMRGAVCVHIHVQYLGDMSEYVLTEPANLPEDEDEGEEE